MVCSAENYNEEAVASGRKGRSRSGLASASQPLIFQPRLDWARITMIEANGPFRASELVVFLETLNH